MQSQETSVNVFCRRIFLSDQLCDNVENEDDSLYQCCFTYIFTLIVEDSLLLTFIFHLI